LKTIFLLDQFTVHHIENKNDVPVVHHPTRLERKIQDRQKDFDAVAWCLRPDFTMDDISKNEFGKPLLGPLYLGISHSHEQVVTCWAPENFGIDIQKVEEKIHRIATKFAHSSELDFAKDAQKLTLIWSAKESVFKYFGHQVDFATEMRVMPFDLSDGNFILRYDGIHHKNQYFRITFKKLNDAYLTIAKPQP
jgi:4'-phosphopantetheinyl transferase EntD